MLVFRNIKESFVEQTVNDPDNQQDSEEGKIVLFKNFGKNYLKVVVANDKGKIIVVTEHWIAKRRLKK